MRSRLRVPCIRLSYLNMTDDCLPYQSSCAVNGSLGWCCSTICYVVAGQSIGFCTKPGAPNCIEDDEECQASGAAGFCCSTFCDQDFGEQFGVCRNRSSNWKPSLAGGLDPNQVVGIAFGTATVFLLIVLISVAVWIWKHRRARLTESEIRAFLEGGSIKGDSDPTCKPYDDNYEICESDFTIDHSTLLGSGEFSVVMKAFVRGQAAAAKTVHAGVTDAFYLKALLTELKILIHVGQRTNIVSLIGASTLRLGQGSCYVFTEFCEHGSLESYLRTHKAEFLKATTKSKSTYVEFAGDDGQSVTTTVENVIRRLIRWCYDISVGMEHLTDLHVVHGDLAARNVLLSTDLTAKISDFGLSRRLYTYTKFVGSKDVPLPWRHLAPESLTQLVFSTQSDVWSFGVTMWEIFSLGDVPYPGLEWSTQFVDCLMHNMRPLRPNLAADVMHEIMTQCWTLDPNQRPSFEWLTAELRPACNSVV